MRSRKTWAILVKSSAATMGADVIPTAATTLISTTFNGQANGAIASYGSSHNRYTTACSAHDAPESNTRK